MVFGVQTAGLAVMNPGLPQDETPCATASSRSGRPKEHWGRLPMRRTDWFSEIGIAASKRDTAWSSVLEQRLREAGDEFRANSGLAFLRIIEAIEIHFRMT